MLNPRKRSRIDAFPVQDTEEYETLAGRELYQTSLTPDPSAVPPTFSHRTEDSCLHEAVQIHEAGAGRDNILFRSPVPYATGADAPNIIDLRSGKYCLWAVDVSDRYQPAGLKAVVAANSPKADMDLGAISCCPRLWTVDIDFFSPDTYPLHIPERDFLYDLVHIRQAFGRLDMQGWASVYGAGFTLLEPGGWIEHTELMLYDGFCYQTSQEHGMEDAHSPDKAFATFPESLNVASYRVSGVSAKDWEQLQVQLTRAGFVNINTDISRMPVGRWSKDPWMSDVGSVMKKLSRAIVRDFLTSVNEDWKNKRIDSQTLQEAEAYGEKLLDELSQRPQVYLKLARMWAQKPITVDLT